MISHLSQWQNISFDNVSNTSLLKMQHATILMERNLMIYGEITYAFVFYYSNPTSKNLS